MSEQVNVLCRGTKRLGMHNPRTVARYSWSASDDVWERIDHGGTDRDWFISGTTASTLVAYPTPRIKCPCGHDPQPTHEDLQRRLSGARDQGELVL